MIAQQESRAMVRMGQAAQSDSAAMKTVAVVTMAFLPATFTAVSFTCPVLRVFVESPSCVS